jgi:hypothetical protein
MEGMGRKLIIFTAAIFLSGILATGCQEQTTGKNAKKGRLVAVENTDLKKQIDQLNSEIQKRDRQIENQKELTAKCQDEKKLVQEEAEKTFKDQIATISGVLVEENAKLQQENEALKAQLGQQKFQPQEGSAPQAQTQ